MENAICSIDIKASNKTIGITWNISTFIKKSQSSDTLCCFIPGFNIYFDAKDEETAMRKAKALTSQFFDHFLIDDPKNSYKQGLAALNKELRSKGFLPKNSNSITPKILKGEPVRAFYDNNNMQVPFIFANESKRVDSHAELCM